MSQADGESVRRAEIPHHLRLGLGIFLRHRAHDAGVGIRERAVNVDGHRQTEGGGQEERGQRQDRHAKQQTSVFGVGEKVHVSRLPYSPGRARS